ncbi:ribonuclease H2, subunit C [Pilaira anomala]|nr:ribonuclease H2, subunit C [Pilaira anomala]
MGDIKVHLLPFSVDREGPINTKEYFKAEKNQDQYETVMLGRKLVGTPVSFTNGTTLGHVWEKNISMDYHYDEEEMDEEDKASNTPWVKTDTTIDEFILWKKDTAPNQQDPRIYALNHWMEMAQTIHESIPLPTTNE